MTHGDNDVCGGDAPRALPLTPGEAARILERLKDYRSVVLAVSGGADSMALMLLVARWLAEQPRDQMPLVEVATVDHGLRPESSEEARVVCEEARALGLTHRTLKWLGPKPSFGIQDAARRARYELLAQHARSKLPPVAVATAHTLEDQAETLLMRLARGSGVDGLAAMPARRPMTEDGHLMLLRPLLTVGKARLVATLVEAGKRWIDDPSNELETFERVRLRRASAALIAAGLTADKLALSAARLGRARQALEAQTASFLDAHVRLNGGVLASVGRDAFLRAPREVRVRALCAMLHAFGGSAPHARLAQVEALEAGIEAGETARTLGGCLVSAGRTTIRVFREPAGRDLPRMEVKPGERAIWDRRFEICLRADTAHLPQPLTVRAIGRDAYATLKSRLGCRLASRPAASLPALWSGEEIVGVPDLLRSGESSPSESGEIIQKAGLVRFRANFVGGWPARFHADDAVSQERPSRG